MSLDDLAMEKVKIDGYILASLQRYIEINTPQNKTEFDFYMNKIKYNYPNLYRYYVLQTLRPLNK